MRLGVIVSPAAGFSYDEIRDLAQGAEKSGFASFWVSDHFFGGPGGTPDRNCLEAWTLLAALARDTTRIRLGVLVAAVQYRNPALQAKVAAGVDHMSGGRLEFGVGAGWKEDEYRAYGYDFPSPGDRVEQLREGLEITRRLWQDDRATYHGKHGAGGADLTPDEMAASFDELERIERIAKRDGRLQRSHWSASTLDGDGKPLIDKIRAYAGVGL